MKTEEQFEAAIAKAQTLEELRAAVVDRLREMKSAIFADGRIDEEELGRLMRVSRPLSSLAGDDVRAFLMALRDANTDGIVTDEESGVLSGMYEAVVDPGPDVCPRCERHLSKNPARCPWCGLRVEG